MEIKVQFTCRNVTCMHNISIIKPNIILNYDCCFDDKINYQIIVKAFKRKAASANG